MRRLVTVLAGLAVLSVLLIPVTGTAAGGRGAAGGGASAPAAQTPPAQPAAQATQQLTPLERQGRSLYLTHCASCHGVDFNGVAGNGPSIRNVGGAAAIEYVLSTGRMPLASPTQIPVRKPPILDREQTDAVVAYVGGQLNQTYMPRASVSNDQQTLFAGRELFIQNCAACHGANGAGAAIGGGYDAPSLHPVEADTVAQAMYIGPGRMPRFAGEAWTQREVDQVASYVLTLGTKEVDRGGLTIGGRGPVAEGFVAWIIGLGLLMLAARLIGKRAPATPTGGGGGDVHHGDGDVKEARS